jgi:hypothetical protein
MIIMKGCSQQTWKKKITCPRNEKKKRLEGRQVVVDCGLDCDR